MELLFCFGLRGKSCFTSASPSFILVFVKILFCILFSDGIERFKANSVNKTSRIKFGHEHEVMPSDKELNNGQGQVQIPYAAGSSDKSEEIFLPNDVNLGVGGTVSKQAPAPQANSPEKESNTLRRKGFESGSCKGRTFVLSKRKVEGTDLVSFSTYASHHAFCL